MIKVVEVISDMNIGGAGMLLLNRLSNANKDIFEYTVILPKGSQLKSRFKSLGIRTLEINGCKDRSFDALAIPKICRILKKIRPDILNAHGALSARIAAKLTGVHIKIYTRHCVYPVNNIYNFYAIRNANKLFNQALSDKIIAVAHSAKQNLIDMGIHSSQISVIINGALELSESSAEAKADLRKRLGITDGATVVSICARLEKCKDHLTFMKAAALMCKISDDYRFLIIGDGALKRPLSLITKHLLIDDKVIFTGFVKDVAPYMNITDINVNCSIGTETSSLALSEGMSLGIPSVVSDYGGNPYMVKNGYNGYIYRQRNARELVKKILLLKDQNVYQAMSKNARARFCNELNAKAMTDKTEALYLSLLNIKKRP